MPGRDLDHADVDSPPSPDPPFGDLVLRTPPNWTAVGFFGMLGAVHLSVSLAAFVAGRWEGYLSLCIGTVFVAASVVSVYFRFELGLLRSERRIRLRNGVGRLCVERFIPLSGVRGVRLTLSNGPHRSESKIELLCPYEDVLCPPTHIPRQQALYMAMALNVPLIKVLDEPEPAEPPPERVSEAVSKRLL